jgi:hypothetical protein
MVKIGVKTLIAIAVFGLTSFGITKRLPANTIRTVQLVRADSHCRHNLCVEPRREKIRPGIKGEVTVFTEDKRNLDTVMETDTCQSLATFSLVGQQEFSAQYQFQAVGPEGVCFAKFSGTSSGQKLGPVKFKVIVVVK